MSRIVLSTCSGGLASLALLVTLKGCAVATDSPTDYAGGEPSTPSATPSPTPSPSETDPPTGEPFQVTIAVEPTLTAAGTLVVTVDSNLPDGAELMGWLSSSDYQGQELQFLDGGRIEFGPYSDDGSRLGSGTYNFSVSMSIARLQSAEVREYIGEKGELMTGPLVTPSMFDEGSSVSFDTLVTIP